VDLLAVMDTNQLEIQGLKSNELNFKNFKEAQVHDQNKEKNQRGAEREQS